MNPDAGEAPVLQITGVETSCVASSYVVTSSRITCRIVQPDSAKVSSLGMQVQVQTTYGVSRLATVAFPTCSPACSVNGTCYWSKDIKGLECVCKSYLNYGAQCQNSASSLNLSFPMIVPVVCVCMCACVVCRVTCVLCAWCGGACERACVPYYCDRHHHNPTQQHTPTASPFWRRCHPSEVITRSRS